MSSLTSAVARPSATTADPVSAGDDTQDLDREIYIVTNANREGPRQEGQRIQHRSRLDGRVYGSWTTPIEFVGALLFDSSASAEHRLFPENH